MTILDLIALALAAGAVLDAWANGSIFEDLRTYIARRADGYVGPPEDGLIPDPSIVREYPWWARMLDKVLPRFFALAWDCLFCSSYHAPAYLLLVFYLPSLALSPPYDTIVKLPIYSLAATRAANLLTLKFGTAGPNGVHGETDDT